MPDAMTESCGSCLIATTTYKYPIFDASTNTVYSLDMARYELKFPPSKIDELMTIADTLTDKGSDYHSARKIGGYRHLHVIKCEETTISLGLVHIGGNNGNNDGVGFVEFNPNKCSKEASRLIEKMLSVGCELVPKRYDLAIDVPVNRESVRMVKDKRKYEMQVGDAITEYLGCRNKAGRVKVYDKAAEQGVEGNLTRIELTASADWSTSKVMESLPTVYRPSAADFATLKGTTKALAVMLMERAANGESIEDVLSIVDYRTSKKIKDELRSIETIVYNREHVQAIREQVSSWASGEY